MKPTDSPPILYLIVPCFNEEETVLSAAKRLHDILYALLHGCYVSPESRILFVDDGSTDRTWEHIRRFAENDPIYAAISLSRNFGHQNALLAGLMEARQLCHVSISLDADLQDDPSVIPAMLERFYQGNDIVYGVRRDRRCDPFFKRVTAAAFYRLIRLLDIQIPSQAGDFRLMSRRAMDALALYPEHAPFLRGLIPRLGFSSSCIVFDRGPRLTGRSKYTLRRMSAFALDGLLSLSLLPLLFILPAGLLMMGAALILLLPAFANRLCPQSICISIWLAGGLIVCALGILALYLAKAYTELLNRPRYIVKETLNLDRS